MPNNRPYIFSFTSSSLLLPETLRVAKYLLSANREGNAGELVLNKGKEETSKRQFRELVKRLKTLTAIELQLLLDSDLPQQRQVAFLAVCKTYGFIRDFVVEALREKFLGFDYVVHEGDYSSFFHRKRELHQEMDDLSDSSLAKIRQNVFLMLEQSGWIDNIKDRRIQPQIVRPDLVKAVVADNPAWLKIFLWPDRDITQAIQDYE
jgi:hypothetical protein